MLISESNAKLMTSNSKSCLQLFCSISKFEAVGCGRVAKTFLMTHGNVSESHLLVEKMVRTSHLQCKVGTS